MRKFYNIVLYAGVIALMLSACKKENDKVINENTNNSEIKVVDLSTDDKTNIQMLYFSSEELFDQTYETLISEIESHEDDFIDTYSSLNEEQLNDKEEEIGFNYQQPLIDFEYQYAYENSMRQVFEVAEGNWLNNEDLDPQTNPNNQFSFDIIEMALLNADGEVKIGDKILKLTKDGYAYILDGNVNTLIRIREGDMSALDDNNVESNIDLSKSNDCKGWVSQTVIDSYSSNKKVYKYRHFHSYPWKGTSLVKLTSYKKKWYGWTKYRMMLSVRNQTFFRDTDCHPAGYKDSGWEHKNRKVLRQYRSKWGSFPQFRAENGISVISKYQYAGISKNEVLSW